MTGKHRKMKSAPVLNQCDLLHLLMHIFLPFSPLSSHSPAIDDQLVAEPEIAPSLLLIGFPLLVTVSCSAPNKH